MMPNLNLNCYVPCSKEKVEAGQCGCIARLKMPVDKVKQEASSLYFSFYTLLAGTENGEWKARQQALLCVNKILDVIEDERKEGFNWVTFYGKVKELLSDDNYQPFILNYGY